MISSNDPEEIRAEMAQTRAAMSETIDALQERLDPQRLKEEATTKIREATIGKVENVTGEVMDNVKETAYEARYGIVDTLRQNPIPAALIGIGLAAMLFNKNGSDRDGRGYRPANGYNGNTQRPRSVPVYGGIEAAPVRTDSYRGTSMPDEGQNVAEQTKSTVQQFGRQAQDKAEDLSGQVKGTVQQFGDQAQDKAENLAGQVKGTVQQVGSQAQDKAENLAGQVKGTVQQVGSQAQDQALELRGTVQEQVGQLSTGVQTQVDQLTYTFNRTLQENPLSLGIVAIALGAAAAMIIPSTPKENELFGETRDQMLQKAESTAHDVLDQAAEQAKKAVSSSTG